MGILSNVGRDRPEDRSPGSFARLSEVMRLEREDRRRCLELCEAQNQQQLDATLRGLHQAMLSEGRMD